MTALLEAVGDTFICVWPLPPIVMMDALSDELGDLLEGGTVVNAHSSCLTVEVEGIEVHVSPSIKHSGCRCCSDSTELRASYNRPQDVDGDPLGLND